MGAAIIVTKVGSVSKACTNGFSLEKVTTTKNVDLILTKINISASAYTATAIGINTNITAIAYTPVLLHYYIKYSGSTSRSIKFCRRIGKNLYAFNSIGWYLF